jgi:glycosyltransferase involved in cell wall biosynthesis
MSSFEQIKLAIVVPAYKAAFLEKALASIAAQTDQRFRVYIGNDGSSEPITEIVRRCYLKSDQLVYKEFESNIGSISLVKHWRRCIELTIEPWVWLFSDDDMMQSDCVAAFYDALEATKESYDIYRFNTSLIDDRDRIVGLRTPHPQWEPWYEFVYFSVNNLRQGNQQEIVFRREAFDRIGGFLDLPLAWWSDIAFTIACATRVGIWTMTKGRVMFRMSRLNISRSRSKKFNHLKLLAMIGFIKWLLQHLNNNDCGAFPGRDKLRNMIVHHFFYKLSERHVFINKTDWEYIFPLIRQGFRMQTAEALMRLIYTNTLFLAEEMRRLCIKVLVNSRH